MLSIKIKVQNAKGRQQNRNNPQAKKKKITTQNQSPNQYESGVKHAGKTGSETDETKVENRQRQEVESKMSHEDKLSP